MSDTGESRALQVLRKAASEDRLAHGILLSGESLEILEHTAMVLAGDLLEPISTSSTENHPANHPDLFHLRPGKKMRLINVDETRKLINSLYKTSKQGGRKVGIIHEADRFNKESGNAFLKSLEEPPEDTYLLLLSTNTYDLLPTLRSRCFRFQIPAGNQAISDASWVQWRSDYGAWLTSLPDLRSGGKPAVNHAIFGLYGLISRLDAIKESITVERTKVQSGTLPENATPDDRTALEARVRRGTQLELFKEIEQTTRHAAIAPGEGNPPEGKVHSFIQTVDRLEQLPGLLRLNLKDITAVEYFMLHALRIWSQA